MAILLISVATLDVAVAFLVSKPLFLCAVIPAAIPILTPVAILDFGQPQG
jgi:hypothetical protein